MKQSLSLEREVLLLSAHCTPKAADWKTAAVPADEVQQLERSRCNGLAARCMDLGGIVGKRCCGSA